MEIQNLKWLNNMDAVISTQNPVGRFSNNRIHVNGVNRFDIGMFIHNTPNSTEHMLHRFA